MEGWKVSDDASGAVLGASPVMNQYEDSLEVVRLLADIS